MSQMIGFFEDLGSALRLWQEFTKETKELVQYIASSFPEPSHSFITQLGFQPGRSWGHNNTPPQQQNEAISQSFLGHPTSIRTDTASGPTTD